MNVFRKMFGKKKPPCMDKKRSCMNPACKNKAGQHPYYDLDKIYFSPSRGLICPIVAPEKKSKLSLSKKDSKCKNMKKKNKDSGPPKEGFCSNEECAKTQPTLLTVPVRKFTFSPRRGILPAELELADDNWAKTSCAMFAPTEDEDQPSPSKTDIGAKKTDSGAKKADSKTSKGSKTSTLSGGKK